MKNLFVCFVIFFIGLGCADDESVNEVEPKVNATLNWTDQQIAKVFVGKKCIVVLAKVDGVDEDPTPEEITITPIDYENAECGKTSNVTLLADKSGEFIYSVGVFFDGDNDGDISANVIKDMMLKEMAEDNQQVIPDPNNDFVVGFYYSKDAAAPFIVGPLNSPANVTVNANY